MDPTELVVGNQWVPSFRISGSKSLCYQAGSRSELEKYTGGAPPDQAVEHQLIRCLNASTGMCVGGPGRWGRVKRVLWWYSLYYNHLPVHLSECFLSCLCGQIRVFGRKKNPPKTTDWRSGILYPIREASSPFLLWDDLPLSLCQLQSIPKACPFN